MKTRVEVTNRKEARGIRAGLEDPATRAFVIVMGALASLPTKRARKRVMEFVVDRFDEHPEDSNA